MTQNWRRLGIIHSPDTTKEWAAHGYCHVPTPLVMGDTVRVFYASLDANNRGSIGYCDLDGQDLTKVKYVSPEPVVRPGPLGAFDCDGVVPSWTDGFRMFYIGFQRCESTPYMLYIGYASRYNLQGEWERGNIVLDRNDEPYSCGAPFVLGDYMWYWSTTHWVDGHYHNDIKITGVDRNIDMNHICLEPQSPDYALGRPWVIKENGIYRMWYSIRRDGYPEYRMGYAESDNGTDWMPKDNNVDSLFPHPAGSDTAEYPTIVDSGGKRWMLYNGMKHGRDGIQLAVLESE